MAMLQRSRNRDSKEVPINFEGLFNRNDTEVPPESLRPALISNGAFNLPRYHPNGVAIATLDKFRYTDGYHNFGSGPDDDYKPPNYTRPDVAKHSTTESFTTHSDIIPAVRDSVEPTRIEEQPHRSRVIVSQIPEPRDIKDQCCGGLCNLCFVSIPAFCCPDDSSRGHSKRPEKVRSIEGRSSSHTGWYDDCCCWRHICCKSCWGPLDCCSPWCTKMSAVAFKIIGVVLLLLLALGIGLAVGLGGLDEKSSTSESTPKLNATFKLNDMTYQDAYNDLNSADSKNLTNRICSTITELFNASFLVQQNASEVSNCYVDRYANGSVWCYMILEMMVRNVNKTWSKSDSFLTTVESVFQSDFNESQGYFLSELSGVTSITDLTVQWYHREGGQSSSFGPDVSSSATSRTVFSLTSRPTSPTNESSPMTSRPVSQSNESRSVTSKLASESNITTSVTNRPVSLAVNSSSLTTTMTLQENTSHGNSAVANLSLLMTTVVSAPQSDTVQTSGESMNTTGNTKTNQ